MAANQSTEWRTVCEKFRLAQELSEIESRKDPENNPFRSKYKARDLLKEIHCSLKKNHIEEEEGEADNEADGESRQMADGEPGNECGKTCIGDSPAGLRAARLAVVHYYLGVNHIETEELSAGEQHLMNCMKLIDKCTTTRENVSLFIQARNQLGILWAGRDEIEKAQRFLEIAESMYLLYMRETRYMEARHCLAAASVIATLAGEIPSEAAAKESDAECEKREELLQKRAEIARCWIKYCLNLMQDAKKLLEDNIGELDLERQEELKRARRNEEEEKEKGRKSAILFGSSDTFDSICSLEEKVSSMLPLDFEEARSIFLMGQSYVAQAKEYFAMDGHVTDHIEILQDHSALFKVLAFFEQDLERRCKMHKRRVDLLEPICKDLNAQYYLLICRQLQFELAETYYEMMDLKLAVADKQDQPDVHTIKKFNHLCSSSMKYYQMFLDSTRSPEGKFPEKLEDDLLRPALVAKFRLARLQSKLISNNLATQLENLTHSLESYSFVVQYCEENPEAKKAVETELELSIEMVSLLPLKINRIRSKMAPCN
ncbi:KIF1-binding protein homolog [Sinocyclocheilus rhinocerous]|uniref:KIF1-binding protein homolog n=1 Tax=Sinocyclocheilus rhinocerous TaxID=307959 RepID=UPI0007B7E13A|nr:PREDICTED: KIF1-binding protein homolog [Sinocyclocheilus rhinocerous]